MDIELMRTLAHNRQHGPVIPSKHTRPRNWLSWRLWVDRVREDSLLRNSLYILGSQVVVAALGFVFWIVAARMYAVADVGLASALINVMTFISTASLLGVATALVRELPSRHTSDAWSLTVNAGLATVTLTGLVAGTVVAIGLPWFSPQFAIVGHNLAYPLALIAGVQLWSLSTVLDGVYVAERAAGYMLVRGAIFALLRIPLVVLPVLVAPAGAFAVICSWVLATAVSLLAGWPLLVYRLKREYHPVMHGITREIRSMLPAYIGHHLINLGYLIPILLLPLIVTIRLSATENAYFYVTWQIGVSLFTISLAVATSLLAEESSHSEDLHREDLHSKVRSSALIIGILYSLAVPAILLGGPFILSLFGPTYAEQGLSILVLVLAAAVPTAITNIYVTTLRLRRHLSAGAALSVAIGALTLVLSWWLLPTMGIAGAGVAWLVAQAFGSLAAGADTAAARIRKRRHGAKTYHTDPRKPL